MQLERTLIFRPSNVHLRHTFCSLHSQTRHGFDPAARSLSKRRDAVVAAQNTGEDLHEDTDDATRQAPAHETPPERGLASSLTRRDLMRGVIGGTIATGAPALVHGGPGTPSAEAIPITSRLPPIGQAAPGTYNIGVAAVRDPALYRLIADLACAQASIYRGFSYILRVSRGMATDQAVRSELRMHGLMPHRHVPLQVEIDRARGALQLCDAPLEKYKVPLHVHRASAVSLLCT